MHPQIRLFTTTLAIAAHISTAYSIPTVSDSKGTHVADISARASNVTLLGQQPTLLGAIGAGEPALWYVDGTQYALQITSNPAKPLDESSIFSCFERSIEAISKKPVNEAVSKRWESSLLGTVTLILEPAVPVMTWGDVLTILKAPGLTTWFKGHRKFDRTDFWVYGNGDDIILTGQFRNRKFFTSLGGTAVEGGNENSNASETSSPQASETVGIALVASGITVS